MKVLLVLASPPLPEGGAPGKHAIALMRGLAAHGVDVHALAADQFFTGSVPSDLPVEIVPVGNGDPGALQRLRRPGGTLLGTPLARRVRELAPTVDVVHLEQVATAQLDRATATPSVVHVHYRVRLDRDVGLFWTAETRSTVEALLAERSALRRHRYLLASSPVVAASIAAAAPLAHVTSAPLSLDPALYPQASLDGAPIAGVIGTADWGPTREGMTRLLERVWPRVRRLVPDARLVVAGRGTHALRARDGVEILGEVPGAAEFLHGISLLLWPLSRGSGMKVKTLEAVACGIPVVTTPAGGEGVDVGDGMMVAVDDDALAAAAAALLSNPADARRRGAVAREAFLERYAPAPATAPVVDLYRTMIGR